MSFNFFQKMVFDITLKYPDYYLYTVIVSSFLYLITIFLIKKYISSLPDPNIYDKKLKPYLFIWNVFLAIFSLVCTIYVIHYMWNYEFSICWENLYNITMNTPSQNSAKISFLTVNLLFSYFKIIEFGDTLFVVLRNKKLLFLHWYHHIMTACFCCVAATGHFGPSVIFVLMNSIVHTIMYSYYAITCYKKIGEPVFLTLIQILQMFIGIGVLLSSYGCKTKNYFIIIFGMIMYISYAIFFIHFFIKRYFKIKKT